MNLEQVRDEKATLAELRQSVKVASLTRDIYGNPEDQVEEEVDRIIRKKLGGIRKLEKAIVNQRKFR